MRCELNALHLAGRASWNAFDKLDMTWNLEVGEPSRRKFAELPLRQDETWFHHDRGSDFLAQSAVRHWERHRLGHRAVV